MPRRDLSSNQMRQKIRTRRAARMPRVLEEVEPMTTITRKQAEDAFEFFRKDYDKPVESFIKALKTIGVETK